jgi:hypothetical protein
MAEIPIPDNYKPRKPSKDNSYQRYRPKECYVKRISEELQQEYQKTVYSFYPVCPPFFPVCPVLKEIIKREKRYSLPDIPKTNFPLLDSIIKILVVFEGITKLRPNEETVVRWAHSENLLAERLNLIRSDLLALPKLLEQDFPDTSKRCDELIAELLIAEDEYSNHGQSLVYLLPDFLESGNWATFLRWREQQWNYVKPRDLSKKIEMCRLTRHYPAEAIKVMLKLYNELSPFLKILPEQAVKNNWLKDELKQILDEFLKPVKTGQNTTPAKRKGKLGRPVKYSEKKIERMERRYTELVKKLLDKKAVWNTIAEEENISSGKAAEMAVRRWRKNHPKKNK